MILFVKTTIQRDDNGRYIVRLPFKSIQPGFPGSLTTALRSFNHLERRLSTNDSLRNEYTSFMQECSDMGHMQVSSLSISAQYQNNAISSLIMAFIKVLNCVWSSTPLLDHLHILL